MNTIALHLSNLDFWWFVEQLAIIGQAAFGLFSIALVIVGLAAIDRNRKS